MLEKNCQIQPGSPLYLLNSWEYNQTFIVILQRKHRNCFASIPFNWREYLENYFHKTLSMCLMFCIDHQHISWQGSLSIGGWEQEAGQWSQHMMGVSSSHQQYAAARANYLNSLVHWFHLVIMMTMFMFVVTRLGIRWWGQARSGARHPMYLCIHHFTNKSGISKLGLILFSLFYSNWSPDLHQALLCQLAPNAPDQCDIVSLLLLIIRPNHWVSLGSFIPPCNQRQFVTMPNEKIPVSSGSYLPITRCLTAACLPCTMARMTRSGASFPHSRF